MGGTLPDPAPAWAVAETAWSQPAVHRDRNDTKKGYRRDDEMDRFRRTRMASSRAKRHAVTRPQFGVRAIWVLTGRV